MLDQKYIAQKQHTFLLVGVLFTLFILFGSLSSQGRINNPLLYLLTLIIPIIFIELGLYLITQADKMKIANIEGKYKFDKTSVLAYRSFNVYKNFKSLIILSILFIAFIIFLIYEIYTKGVIFSLTFYLVSGFLLAYILILRWFLIKLYNIINTTKYKFLANYGFWFSIMFFIFSVWIAYNAIVNPEILTSKVNSTHTTFYRFIFLGTGMLFSFVSLLILPKEKVGTLLSVHFVGYGSVEEGLLFG